MLLRSLLLLCALGTAAIAPPADARPRDREQDAALRARQEGRMMSLRTIRARIHIPGAQHIGTELDPRTGRYRLKFMRGSQVIWVDVDGRTGEVVGHTGR